MAIFIIMDIHLLNFVIISLAVARVSYLLVYEDGPFDFVFKLREAFGVHVNEYGIECTHEIDESKNLFLETIKSEVSKAVVCVYCNSIWIGLVVTLAYAFFPVVGYCLLPFAMSSIAILFKNHIHEDE